MNPAERSALLHTALDDIAADGIAIGAATRATTGFACLGAVAGRTVDPDTVAPTSVGRRISHGGT